VATTSGILVASVRPAVPEEVLSDDDRSRLDERDDHTFYTEPRYVHHVDEAFRRRLRALYRKHLEAGDRVLDLMSSWVSHLPDIEFEHVVGHGLNGAELERNPRLDEHFLQDLNDDQSLPLPDGAFDAVLCAVSVQYLQYPAAVFAEVGRVLRPGGVVVVSFSNRMFPTKAVRAWRVRSMDERGALVRAYLDAAGQFDHPEVVAETEPGEDPFHAVVAQRSG